MDQEIMRLRVETMRGNIDGVKSALSKGVSVDQPFRNGEWNALMHASSLGHHEIVLHLLQEGADPNFHKELFTPLMAASASNIDNEEKLLKCVSHLINFSANVNAIERHRLSPLMFACKQGHAKIVQHLVACNIDLNAHDSQGWTALFWAVSKGKTEIVKILLAAGANKNEVDRSGATALLVATRKGFNEIVNILRSDNKAEENTLQRLPHMADYDDNFNLSPIEKSRYIESSETSILPKIMNGGNHKDASMIGILKDFQIETVDENEDSKYISAVKILAEFATKMSIMHATMALLRYKFNEMPIDSQKSNKWYSITSLRTIAGLACYKSELLYMEIKYFNERLAVMDADHAILKEPVEFIEKNPPVRTSIVPTAILVSACVLLVVWNVNHLTNWSEKWISSWETIL